MGSRVWGFTFATKAPIIVQIFSDNGNYIASTNIDGRYEFEKKDISNYGIKKLLFINSHPFDLYPTCVWTADSRHLYVLQDRYRKGRITAVLSRIDFQ